MFAKLFNESLVFLDYPVESAEDFIRKMSSYLESEGMVLPTYVDAVLNREKVFPTGLPTIPFPVAIPHGDPEHVIKPCIVVAKPTQAIEFGEMGSLDHTVMAHYIFMLVIKKAEDQIVLLQSMIDMFMNEEAMNRLDEAKTKAEMIEVLSSYLHKKGESE